MKTILGTGQLGMAILDILLQQDPAQPILLVNRSGKSPIKLPGNVAIMAADVTSKTNMETVAELSGIIFSCTDRPYQLWESFYPATANALGYALENTNARLVFADNMYSYGNVMGGLMNERLRLKTKTKKGRIRTEVINTLLRSGKPFSKRVAFVKAADFIGPNIHKGLFGTDFLTKLYSNKRIALFGNTDLPHTFTYIEDFAKAMINIGNANDAYEQIWHVPNAPAITLNDWIRLFENASGKKAKTMVLPKWIVKAAGLFDPLVKELYELAYQFEHPYLVDHSKYAKQFGEHFTEQEIIADKTIKWFISGSSHDKH